MPAWPQQRVGQCVHLLLLNPGVMTPCLGLFACSTESEDSATRGQPTEICLLVAAQKVWTCKIAVLYSLIHIFLYFCLYRVAF